MLRILDRYLLRELALSVIATAVVLLVIVTGGTFARVLQQVANGSFPASIMFQVLGLNMLDASTGLLPMALFLGVLMSLSRLYRDSEMHVLASSGMGPRGLMRPALLLGVPMAVLIALVSLWLGPWSVRTSHALIASANRSVIAAGLEAGRFTELPGRGGIIFVDSMNRSGTRLGKVFVASDTAAHDGQPERIKVITAKRGELYQDNAGNRRFLALFDGWQFEVPLGRDNWRRMRYARNDTALSEVQADNEPGDSVHALPTATLFSTDGTEAQAELAWRAVAPVTSLVLVLLALPLSRQTPREPRYGRLLIAVLVYFLYLGLMSLAKAMLAQGKVATSAPLWVLQIIMAVFALWAFWRQYRPWKPRGVST